MNRGEKDAIKYSIHSILLAQREMTKQQYNCFRSQHVLHALSRNIKLHLGFEIPGIFKIPQDVREIIMQNYKERFPDTYKRILELGPHFRGIEPTWYPEAAQNEVKLIEDEDRLYYGQVNAKGGGTAMESHSPKISQNFSSYTTKMTNRKGMEERFTTLDIALKLSI
jgi:hypothetical protein